MFHVGRNSTIFYVWLLFLHISGVYIFTKGFFLTRFEVNSWSECSEPPGSFSTQHSTLRGSLKTNDFTSDDCWYESRFKKAIVIIIDALRYDFAAFIPQEFDHSMNNSDAKFYLNHIPIFESVLKRYPNNSLLYKFRADPPTMTMQRLKGITTGSLPTFMDFKDNMHSSEITEDSIIRQMWKQEKRIVFMGDNTWDSLYSKYFTRNYSYDSFNVKDLHTVDNGVIANLFPEMEKSDWEVIIAHFLGVDHVGHTFGPSDPHMEDKLKQMNTILERVINRIKDDTLLVVMGDHGMSSDGNHGGATSDETDAALFLYSKKLLHQWSDDSVYHNWVRQRSDKSKSISQVDLVPTLSLLLGVPIPYGNLGSIIPELFFLYPVMNSRRERNLHGFNLLNTALDLNVHQVRRYLKRYAGIARISSSDISHLDSIYDTIKRLWDKRVEVDRAERIELEASITDHLRKYLQVAIHLGRKMWTQFDLVLMGWGIVILLFTFICIIAKAIILEADICLTWSLKYGLMYGIPFAIIIPGWCDIVPSEISSRLLIFPSFFMEVSFLYNCLYYGRASIRSNFNIFFSICAIVCVVFHGLGLLSNSYIVAEEKVLTFLSTTGGVVVIVSVIRNIRKVNAVYILMGIISLIIGRLSSYMDQPNVIHTTVTVLRTIIPLVFIPLEVLLEKQCQFTKTGKHIVPNYITFLFVLLYWIIDPEGRSVWIPRFYYMSGILGILWWVFGHRYTAYEQLRVNIGRDIRFLVIHLIGILALLLGPKSPGTLFCMVLQLEILIFCISSRLQLSSLDYMSWAFIWCIVMNHYYFSTGHHTNFSSLQNAAGLVGFDEFSFYTAGSLLLYNTFGTFVICLLAMPLVVLQELSQDTIVKVHDTIRKVPIVYVSASMYFTLNAVITTIFVAFQRRHLMVWAIFAPKYIFDAVILLVVDFFIVLFMIPYSRFESMDKSQAKK